jgi:hypothetical protein
MENINIKKIENLINENNELDKLIKELVNNHENIFFNKEKDNLIYSQNFDISILEKKNKYLYESYNNLKYYYPRKYPIVLEKNI